MSLQTSIFHRKLTHPPRWILWALVLVDVLALAGCLALSLGTRLDQGYLPELFSFGLFPIAGAVILWKQPRNTVGWLAAALGFVFVFNELLFLYSSLALIIQPGRWPLGGLISWVSSWIWQFGYGISIALIVLIPNGRPISRRWGWLVWFSALVVLPAVLLNMVLLWPYRGVVLVKGSNDISALPVSGIIIKEMIIWQSTVIACLVLAVIGLVRRFILARRLERQQLKWIMLACALVPVSMMSGVLSDSLRLPWLEAFNQAMNILSVVAFPVSFAFAITRYHLYDIDVIIRRTLVYSTLTLILALVYLGSVLVLQSALTALTGQGSALGVVLSTLLIAALFAPLRRGIQAVIDKRFYRQKYNSDQMLEQFAASTRSELEVEHMTGSLLQVIDDTLQPEHVSLWLRRSTELTG